MSETMLNGRYRLVAQQGSGGMAVIYKAVDQELGRTVAVKILRPSLTNDPEFLKRFKNEARNVANLSHPNIVTVYDVGSDGNTHYIVMEFIDGSDLKKLIRKETKVPVDVAVDLGIQICAGIGLAHRAGLVHADVKPQNVLLTSSRQVKVTDFGIAQAFSKADVTAEREAVVWGSPHYFAPEQARGEKPTPSSDVYSIGIVMFEMLTGQLPYTGNNQQELAIAHIRDDIPRVSDINPQVPDELSRIIYKVMGKEPAGRYRMADQLGQILVKYRDKAQQHTAPNPRVFGKQTSPEPDAPQPGASIPAPDARFQRPGANPPQQGRPLYREPEQPPADPTQRYNVVPDAPSPVGRASVPAATSAAQMPNASATGGMVPPPDVRRQRAANATEGIDAGGGLDAVTIVLAFLAFVAVACLIPLYIAVFMAYTN
jgi:eukaryotic-like serine/threonine-protein kinase